MPYWFKRMVAFFSWHVKKGWDAGRMIARGLTRFSDKSRDTIENAVALAQESVDNAARASRLGRDQPISAALREGANYDDEVTVSTAVRVRTSGRGESIITIKATVPWFTTRGELEDIIRGITQNKMRRYNVLEVQIVAFIGPLMFRYNQSE